jgi:tRNA A37 threonylcarbamoyladenosine dehydratase
MAWPEADSPALQQAQEDRRFGGLRRLYGPTGYEAVRQGRVAVVGLGGVGSWAVEALARSGVAALTLIDFDHVAESNVNRQIQALGATLGMSKGTALMQRIADIHPACRVLEVDAFVEPDNWPGLLPEPVDVLIDACDQLRAKAALAAWGWAAGVPVVCVGAAGGKTCPQAVEVGDLASVSHDRLLASLRQRLRQHHGGRRQGAMGVRCVFSREAVRAPQDLCAPQASGDGSLNCQGYGSSVVVTSVFGMVAASEALSLLVAAAPKAPASPGPA